MKTRRRPKACGGCGCKESAVWHRQRGNNRYLCTGCQAKKLSEKDGPSNSTIKTEIEDPDYERGNSQANTEVDNSKNQADTNSEIVITQNAGDKIATTSRIQPESTALEEEKIEEETLPNNDGIEELRADEPSAMEEDAPTEEHQSKKSKKSAISHPRLTRLRSSTRPIRAAALAAANKCQSQQNEKEKEKQSNSRSSSAAGSTSKSAVSNASGSGFGGTSGLVVPRNKGRRHIFKLAKPEKASFKRASISTYASLWHKGQMFRQHDVVAVVDEQDENVYYGLVRGLLRNEYCEQYAALTWLLPTTASPLDRSFDAATYMLGPEDETFYPMDSLEFICHIDSEYFTSRGATLASTSAAFPKSIIQSPILNPKDQFVGVS